MCGCQTMEYRSHEYDFEIWISHVNINTGSQISTLQSIWKGEYIIQLLTFVEVDVFFSDLGRYYFLRVCQNNISNADKS